MLRLTARNVARVVLRVRSPSVVATPPVTAAALDDEDDDLFAAARLRQATAAPLLKEETLNRLPPVPTTRKQTDDESDWWSPSPKTPLERDQVTLEMRSALASATTRSDQRCVAEVMPNDAKRKISRRSPSQTFPSSEDFDRYFPPPPAPVPVWQSKRAPEGR
jgi:hypothetical protein